MILLWGLASEVPLATVRSRLTDRHRTCVLLDQRLVVDTRAEVVFDDPLSGEIEWGGLRIDLARVTAAYLRPYDPRMVPAVAAAGAGSDIERRALDLYQLIHDWAELSPALMVNRPSAGASNSSKPYQAELIRAVGFAVPETLITTDPDAAREFCERHGQVIYKSVSGVRSIVSRLSSDKAARLDAVRACPTQFQRWIAGTDVRVHVVGDDVFACELSSPVDDYRYASRQGAKVSRRPIELPDPWPDRCRALARAMDLVFAGIDLRRTPDGEWCCFEVNPSPGFTYYDDDGRIANCVAALLMSARRRS